MSSLMNQNCNEISYETIRAAMKGKHYPMELVGEDAAIVMDEVNKGIDAHLEACNSPERGDNYEWNNKGRLICLVSPESLPTLLRRLFESDANDEDDNPAALLASDILSTLNINEYGRIKENDD